MQLRTSKILPNVIVINWVLSKQMFRSLECKIFIRVKGKEREKDEAKEVVEPQC